MFNWCIEELQFWSALFKKTRAVSVFTADVVKSDTAIPESLCDALREAVKPLEDTPNRAKDWHPGLDGKALNLVHSSLFLLVYN